MYDLEAIERVSKKDIHLDEYVFEYWNQLRRDPMYVKSMMSVENSEMLSILDQLSNWKEDCRDDQSFHFEGNFLFEGNFDKMKET